MDWIGCQGTCYSTYNSSFSGRLLPDLWFLTFFSITDCVTLSPIHHVFHFQVNGQDLSERTPCECLFRGWCFQYYQDSNIFKGEVNRNILIHCSLSSWIGQSTISTMTVIPPLWRCKHFRHNPKYMTKCQKNTQIQHIVWTAFNLSFKVCVSRVYVE